MSLTIALILLAALGTWTANAEDGAEFFRQSIRPIFSSRCQGCHNDTLKFSGLSLDSAAGLRTGGLHGPVVAAGNPQASRLYRKVAHLEKPVMPMQGDPLTGDEVALVKRWIEMGAPWPEDAAALDAEKAKQDRGHAHSRRWSEPASHYRKRPRVVGFPETSPRDAACCEKQHASVESNRRLYRGRSGRERPPSRSTGTA